MLVKHIQGRVGLVRSALSFATMSGLHQSNDPQSSETHTSKHNPMASKDLRGLSNMGQLTEAEQSMSPIHSQKYRISTLYHFCSLLGNSTARCIGSLVDSPKSAIAGDSLHLPKIYPGGVPVYDCVDSVNSFLIVNKVLSRLAPLSIVFLVPAPALTLAFNALGMYVYNHFVWRFARHLVIKAELLPQTEELVYQKLTMWGSIATKKVKIGDLELTSVETLIPNGEVSERGVRGLINREIVYQVKGSSELLMFERNGWWHEAGISHPLLV